MSDHRECFLMFHIQKLSVWRDVFAHFLSLINRPPNLILDLSFPVSVLHILFYFLQPQQNDSEVFSCISFSIVVHVFLLLFFGSSLLMLHHFGPNARLLLVSNSAYSRSFCSHSLMLTEWGCDSICVGCKTGMIVELGICVFNDAIIEDYTSPSSYLKMTQHIITARLTHATLSGERMGGMKDEIIINVFLKQRCH